MYVDCFVLKCAQMRKANIREHEIEELYAVLLRFIRCDTRGSDGQTLLHVAVNAITSIDEYRFDTYQFPCFRTALLLVHAGASVTTVDIGRNTPLHTFIGSLKNSTIGTTQAEKIVKLFVEVGAHLDAVNENGLTPAQLCVHPTITSLLLSYQNANTTLKCIAARSIAVNRINYAGMVPKVLESFIETHSAKKPCT